MLALHSGMSVHLALGATDMRKGFDGLTAQVQTVLKADPFSGYLFLFRGRRGDPLKALWWDGQGLVMLAKAPMPSLPIERGRSGPGLLAHVLVSKYCDHLPLYRQSEIYAREGLDLLPGWVGKVAPLAEPMAASIGRHALAGSRVHADGTVLGLSAR
jgi:transposase